MALTLDYNFIADKSLVARTGPTLTCTRSTEGTYFDSSGLLQNALGNVGRFDHDPDTLESLGLLVESTRTNLALYSEDLSNAAWVASNVTKGSDSVTDPRGAANTAVRLTASAGNGTCLQSITSTSADRGFSVFLKRVTGTGNIDLTIDGGTGWTTVTVTDSWKRFEILQTGVTNPQVGVRIVTSADAVDFFGAQLETGAFVSSYFGPTTTVSRQRNADNVFSTDVTWYNSTLGTIYAQGSQPRDVATTDILVEISDASTSDRQYIAANTDEKPNCAQVATTTQANITSTVESWTNGKMAKVAWSYAEDDIKAAANGASIGTDALATLPSGISRISVGARYNGSSNFWHGHIQSVRYYDTQYTAAQLATLTAWEVTGLVTGDSFSDGVNEWPTKLQSRVTSVAAASATLVTELEPAWAAQVAAAASTTTFALIQGGINDIAGGDTLADIQTAIQSMIVTAKSANLNIGILAVAPWKNLSGWSAGEQTITDDYNSWLSAQAAPLGFTFIDIYTPLEGPADELAAAYDFGDGLHPNDAGHQIIAEAVDAVVSTFTPIPAGNILLSNVFGSITRNVTRGVTSSGRS